MEPLQPILSVANRRQPLLSYFCFIINWGYFVMLIPFRFRKVVRSKGVTVEICYHRIHQICCGVVHFFVMYEFVTAVCLISSGTHKNDRIQSDNISAAHVISTHLHEDHVQGDKHGYHLERHVDQVQGIMRLAYGLVFMYLAWGTRGRIQKSFRLLQKMDFYEDDATRKRIKFRVWVIVGVLCFCSTAFAVIDSIMHDSTLIRGDFGKYFSGIYSDAVRYYMFQDPDVPIECFTCLILSYIFATIHFVIALPAFLLVHWLEIFLLLDVIASWHLMKHFVEFSKRELDIKQVLLKYDILKELINTVNGVMGLPILCCVGISLPFYAFWAAVVYFEEHVMTHFLIYFGTFFLILTIAADFNSKASKFYAWVSSEEISDGISTKRLISLSIDMTSNQIALKGYGFFTLTYRFFGTILSVLVTYTMVIIQFQSSGK